MLVPTAIGVARQNTAQAQSLQFADTVNSTVADVLAARLPDSHVVSVERSRQGSTLELRVTAEVAKVPSLAEVGAIQAEIATRLGRASHVILIAEPVVEIDPSRSVAPSTAPAPSPSPAPAPSGSPTATPMPTAPPTPASKPSPPNTSTRP